MYLRCFTRNNFLWGFGHRNSMSELGVNLTVFLGAIIYHSRCPKAVSFLGGRSAVPAMSWRYTFFLSFLFVFLYTNVGDLICFPTHLRILLLYDQYPKMLQAELKKNYI